MGWTSGGGGCQHGFAEGVPDFGAVTSWCRTSGTVSVLHTGLGIHTSLGNVLMRVGGLTARYHTPCVYMYMYPFSPSSSACLIKPFSASAANFAVA
eukprot:3204781-Alexandrium_andersonii.AAC.1